MEKKYPKCLNCGKSLKPYKKAKNFVSKKWDGHSYKPSCQCFKNKDIRISIG